MSERMYMRSAIFKYQIMILLTEKEKDTSPRIYPWKKQRILSLFQAPGLVTWGQSKI